MGGAGSESQSIATVVMAHLTAQTTRQDVSSRAQAKFMLTRRLYDLGYNRDTIIDLFRFIDWLMRLPDDLEQQVWQALQQYEEEHHIRLASWKPRRFNGSGGNEQRRMAHVDWGAACTSVLFVVYSL